MQRPVIFDYSEPSHFIKAMIEWKSETDSGFSALLELRKVESHYLDEWVKKTRHNFIGSHTKAGKAESYRRPKPNNSILKNWINLY
jgi:hypothetical protein